MSKKPENPRAFPSNAIDDRYGGASLRDLYAGMAMVGCIMDRASWGVDHTAKAPDFACWAFDIADAMMVERERRA